MKKKKWCGLFKQPPWKNFQYLLKVPFLNFAKELGVQTNSRCPCLDLQKITSLHNILNYIYMWFWLYLTSSINSIIVTGINILYLNPMYLDLPTSIPMKFLHSLVLFKSCVKGCPTLWETWNNFLLQIYIFNSLRLSFQHFACLSVVFLYQFLTKRAFYFGITKCKVLLVLKFYVLE